MIIHGLIPSPDEAGGVEASGAANRAGRDDREFVQSLARGLDVLQAFNRDHPRMTLSEEVCVDFHVGRRAACCLRWPNLVTSAAMANISGSAPVCWTLGIVTWHRSRGAALRSR